MADEKKKLVWRVKTLSMAVDLSMELPARINRLLSLSVTSSMKRSITLITCRVSFNVSASKVQNKQKRKRENARSTYCSCVHQTYLHSHPSRHRPRIHGYRDQCSHIRIDRQYTLNSHVNKCVSKTRHTRHTGWAIKTMCNNHAPFQRQYFRRLLEMLLPTQLKGLRLRQVSKSNFGLL